MLHDARLERLSRNKHSSLLDPFVTYEKVKCCEYGPGSNLQILGCAVFVPSIPFKSSVIFVSEA